MADEKTQSNIISAETKFKYKILKQVAIFSGAVSLIVIGSIVPNAISATLFGAIILLFGDWN